MPRNFKIKKKFCELLFLFFLFTEFALSFHFENFRSKGENKIPPDSRHLTFQWPVKAEGVGHDKFFGYRRFIKLGTIPESGCRCRLTSSLARPGDKDTSR